MNPKISALWGYDLFPFALASEVIEVTDTTVQVKGYGQHKRDRKTVVLVVEDESGPSVSDRLETLERNYRLEVGKLNEKFHKLALESIPELALLHNRYKSQPK